MMKSIAPILCFGLILCMGTIPSSAAITDDAFRGLYGPGGSGNLIALSSDTLEWIERPMMHGNTSGEDGVCAAEIQAEAKSERDGSLFLPATASRRPLYKPGSLIVRFKPDVAGSPSRLARASDTMHSQLGATVAIDYSDLGLPGMQVVQLPKGVSVPEAIAAYSQNPNVLYAEPNYYRYCDGNRDEFRYTELPTPAPTSMPGGGGGSGRIPNDPEFGNLWGLHNVGQAIRGINGTVDADIDASEAWSITTGSQDVIIAVIDTGVMYTHPDLAANIWKNPGEIPGNGIDDDGNGYLDDVYGWNFYDDNNDPDDLHGHGTHCAGTIAAVGNNAEGVAGVMWNATIMPLQFLGPDGYGEDADAILAIQYATMMGADIISCSWGGGDDNQALRDAINATPALVVCAAGNEALDNDAVPHYPSSYDCENILAVAASNNTERLASFSNIGATSVDVVAPGASILSTYVIPEWVEVYHDPMDSLEAWDADAPWGLNTTYYTSAPSSADDSPGGNYAPNTTAWLTTKNPIDLQGLRWAELTFDARYDLEDGYDRLYVASSLNDTLYYMHGYLTGSSDGKWYTYDVPLSTYGEDAIYIGFILVTDGSVQKDGVLIDEVCVRGIESVSASYAYMSGTSMATPHVSGVAGLVRSANASLSTTEIKDAIINTVDTKPAYAGKVVSGGRVNAYRAVSAVVPVTGQPLSIVSSKESVVRSHSFVVTISGEASSPYWLYVRDAGLSSAEEYPLIAPHQVGVTPGVDMAGITDATNFTYARAQITTNAGKTRPVQFNTTCLTKARNFTITVVDPADTTLSSDVVVRVEQGSVTVAAPGTGTYYVGEEITLSGTNTDSDITYLFLTGPSLNASGVRLEDPAAPVMDGTPATFTRVDVKADETWSYSWNTADLNGALNPGNYTIHAVSTPRDKAHLSDAVYATTTIQLRVPSITAGASSATLAPGDDLLITGVAGGTPDVVQIWIFGPGYYGGYDGALGVRIISVEADGTFRCTLRGAETHALQGGLYYVVVQHPVDRDFGVMADTANGVMYGVGIANVTLTTLQAFDAATALITALDSPGVDDIYARLSFEVIDSAPQVNFTANITTGPAPLAVRFTDISTGNPTAWLWSFGDGATSTEQHPIHTYTTAGIYTVNLTAANSAGLNTTARIGYITVSSARDILWDVPLSITSGTFSQTMVLGSAESATRGFDGGLDIPIPPEPPGAKKSVYFTCTDPIFGELATDYRAPIDSANPEEIWTLALRSDEPVQVAWNTASLSESELFLTWNDGVSTVAMKATNGTTLPAGSYSIIITAGTVRSMDLPLQAGWSLISTPFNNATYTVPEGSIVAIYGYNTSAKGYETVPRIESLVPGMAYWIASSRNCTVTMTGAPASPVTAELKSGWNLIGSTTSRTTFDSIAIAPEGSWAMPFVYGYDLQARSYVQMTELQPAEGYWGAVTGDCTITLP